MDKKNLLFVRFDDNVRKKRETLTRGNEKMCLALARNKACVTPVEESVFVNRLFVPRLPIVIAAHLPF